MEDPPCDTQALGGEAKRRPEMLEGTHRVVLPTRLFRSSSADTSGVANPEEQHLDTSLGFTSQSPAERGFGEWEQLQGPGEAQPVSHGHCSKAHFPTHGRHGDSRVAAPGRVDSGKGHVGGQEAARQLFPEEGPQGL